MVAYMTDAVLANITKQKVLIDQIIYFVPNWQITNNKKQWQPKKQTK